MEVPIRASRLSAILKILGTDGANPQLASAPAFSQLLLTLVSDSAAVTGIDLTNGVLKLTVSARVTQVLLEEEPEEVHADSGNIPDDLDDPDFQSNLAVGARGPSVDAGTRHSSPESRADGTVAKPNSGGGMTLEDIELSEPTDVEPMEGLGGSQDDKTAQSDPRGPTTTAQQPLKSIVLEDLD